MANKNKTEAAPLEGDILSANEGRLPTEREMVATLNKAEGVIAQKKMAIIEAHARSVLEARYVVSFRGRLMVEEAEPFSHFVPLSKDKFDRIAYPILGGVPRSMVGDVYAYLSSVAEDLTANGHLVLFGLDLADAVLHPELTDQDAYFANNNRRAVWNTRDLTWEFGADFSKVVWRSPYPRVRVKTAKTEPPQYDDTPLPFIMQLAGGNQGVYDDIMQSIAPIVMEKKPDGVIWWVGTGANGKSTLMDALYRVFPSQFASINVRRLTDGRDTPSLNGKLANIVKESSEGRVDDTEIYKALGTHENFRVHKFHSQDDTEIDGNIHTIFSANSIPTFNDKGYSARRRTFIIPFTQQFDSDPDFEARTFTAEFFGKLVNEMTRYAERIRRQGYRYKWSAKTRDAKLEYDREANCAEEYAQSIINEGVVAFHSYNPVKIDYENWCADNGYVPLGIGNLRKALTALGFERSSIRSNDGQVTNIYKLPDVGTNDLQQFGMGRPGLLTTTGFRAEVPDPEPVEEKPKQTSILNNKW